MDALSGAARRVGYGWSPVSRSSSEPAKGVPDGMRLDKNGNIYSSGPGGVWIISPEGKHIGTIKVPEVVSNVAWGDEDGKTLYITASTSIYSHQAERCRGTAAH